MDLQTLRNETVLSTLVGRLEAEQLLKNTGGHLAPLIGDSVATYCSDESAMTRLVAAKELVQRGLTEELQMQSVLNSVHAVRQYLRLHFAGREYEMFSVLFLDAQLRLLVVEEMFRGTVTQTSVYPREIVKRALFHNACNLIFAHNHPSGSSKPSRADQLLTVTLRQALQVVDVGVLDHFVVGVNSMTSFSEMGLL